MNHVAAAELSCKKNLEKKTNDGQSYLKIVFAPFIVMKMILNSFGSPLQPNEFYMDPFSHEHHEYVVHPNLSEIYDNIKKWKKIIII